MAAKKKNSLDKLSQYWSKHPHYTSLVHTGLGVGLGLLIQPLWQGDSTPIGWALVALGVLGHLYALVA